jgi:hypothetical protein
VTNGGRRIVVVLVGVVSLVAAGCIPNGTWASTTPVAPGVEGMFPHFQRRGLRECDFCVAVGSTNDSEAGILEAYDGSTWHAVDISDLGDGGQLELFHVACASPTLCVASGWTPTKASFAITWNGGTWAEAKTPPDAARSTSEVRCRARGDACVVDAGRVGRSKAYRFDGATWSTVDLPADDEHWTVRRDLSVAGQVCGDPTRRALRFRLRATSQRWPVGRAADLAGGRRAVTFFVVGDISCATANWCVAVGSVNAMGPMYAELNGTPAVSRWDGTSWVATLLPDAVYGRLTSVSCASGAECVAVGITSDWGLRQRDLRAARLHLQRGRHGRRRRSLVTHPSSTTRSAARKVDASRPASGSLAQDAQLHAVTFSWTN